MKTLLIGMLALLLCGCRGAKNLSGGVRLRIDSLYVRADTFWFGMRAKNTSAYTFRPAPMQLILREKHPVWRMARQEVRLPVLWSSAPGVLGADTVVWFDCGTRPRIPGPGRDLWIEWIERNGDRRVRVRISNRQILRAKRVEPID